MTQETDLAWAAGFFDGEGSVGTYWFAYPSRCKRYRKIQAQVAQTSRQPLDELVRLFGGKVHEVFPKGQRQRTWYWSLQSRESVGIMFTRLWPYLKVKKKAFDDAIDKYDQGPASVPYAP